MSRWVFVVIISFPSAGLVAGLVCSKPLEGQLEAPGTSLLMAM